MDTIRVVLSIAAQNQWPMYQMDVKLTFLNGILEEEVYVDHPPGYITKVHEHKVFNLKRALYGLTQAPQAWYSRIDSYLINNGFNKRSNDPTLYVKKEEGKMLMVCIYIKDMIYTCNLMLADSRTIMKKEFEMTDLGLIKCFLGMKVTQTTQSIFIFHQKYATNVLQRFRMINVNQQKPPLLLAPS